MDIFLDFKTECIEVYKNFSYDIYLIFFETFRGNLGKVSYLSVVKFYNTFKS